MKKIIAMLLVLVMVVGLLAGCGNKTMLDTTYRFDRAIIQLPDGTIVKGKVEKWTDYEDGDQLQITIDGVTYLVHSSQAVLIAGGPSVAG